MDLNIRAHIMKTRSTVSSLSELYRSENMYPMSELWQTPPAGMPYHLDAKKYHQFSEAGESLGITRSPPGVFARRSASLPHAIGNSYDWAFPSNRGLPTEDVKRGPKAGYGLTQIALSIYDKNIPYSAFHNIGY